MTDTLRDIKIMILVCDFMQTLRHVPNIPMWQQWDIITPTNYHKYIIKGNDDKYPYELYNYCDDECKLKNIPAMYYGSQEQIACIIEYCNKLYMPTHHNVNTNKRKRQ